MKRARRILWLLAALLGGSLALIAFVLAGRHFASDPDLAPWLGGLGLAAAVLTALVFWLLDRLFVAAGSDFARAVEHALVATPPRRERLPPAPPGLEAVAGAVGQLLERLDAVEANVAAERERALRELEEQRRRLAAILRDLGDGLVCCTLDGRILLYNDAARAILGDGTPFGLGRPLFERLHRTSLLHHLGLLRREALRDPSAPPVSEPFLAMTARGERILRCRLSLVMEPGAEPEGFVLVFAEVGEQALRLGSDAFFERLASAWRGPLASLRAAAELLQEQLRAEAQAQGFLRVVLEESGRLEAELQRLAQEGRRFVLAQTDLFDIEAGDLIEIIREQLRERGIAVEVAAPPAALWFAADSFALSELLIAFLAELARLGVTRVNVDGRFEDERVRLELCWQGPVPSSRCFEEWLNRRLFEPLGVTARDLAARHGSTPWVAPRTDQQGGFLRLDLPAPRGLHPVERRPRMAARPEFYDFDLLDRGPGDLSDVPLDRLTCVVFDTETTGLDPAHDELVQIGAVRLVNGRILRGEIFDALIDPGRPIPPEATRIHGITNDMVTGRPPPPVVVARFAEFARDAVLVAHNAAFDLALLRRWENEAGVKFDHPVLDTLLLSAVLHEDIEDHSLDSIAARLGIPVRARHSALGDALATAEVFVRLIELLRLRAMTTLGEALAASRKVALRRQRLFSAHEGSVRP